MLITVFSHIVGALYIQKQKYNKLLTACFWGAYAIFAACVMIFQENIVYGFFELLFMQAIIFYITSIGSIGEKLFLFLTYSNSFCIYIGVNTILSNLLGNTAHVLLCTVGILILIHMFLYKILIPSYRKSKMFFTSGWWKYNIVLILFMMQFLNQYAFFDGYNEGLVYDFIIFSIIFYLTLILAFDSVKNVALTNKKSTENEELEKIAYIDALTKLQSRVSYTQFTKKQALLHKDTMSNSSFVFVMTDIDGFKKINDIKGHTIGDEVLKCVGSVINEHFKNFKCESFRIGGDEFVLLFENKQISDVEDQIIKMNEKLYNSYKIKMSYGCCEVNFDNEKPFEVAYKKADMLMYSNKEQNKLHI
jgi:diguanylate cyclase (GGDEF)-like protein